LAYRVRANLSLGRHIVADERVVLSAEIGPGYVAEKKGDDREGFAAGRVAQYLEILMADNWQVWESLEYVQNLEDSAVYFITAEVGLEVALTGSMTLKFSVENRYDNQPAANKKSNDLLTTTALSWSF
jgi:putative salt-induced outer membrane protein YdiY